MIDNVTEESHLSFNNFIILFVDVTQFNFIRISKAFATTPRFATLANIGGSGEKYREIPDVFIIAEIKHCLNKVLVSTQK